jgi:hypothetical protein
MKLGGSLGNVPKKKKNLLKISIYLGLLVHPQECNLPLQGDCTLEDVLAVGNISSFFLFLHGTLPSDPKRSKKNEKLVIKTPYILDIYLVHFQEYKLY